jgi:hypothetical protein
MKHLLLLIPLAACAQHVDPCLRPIVENPLCVEMDRADHSSLLVHHPDGAVDGGHNGSGSASSDAVSDDSNGDGSDE